MKLSPVKDRLPSRDDDTRESAIFEMTLGSAFFDLRTEPRYTIAEAAHYLWMRPATLRTWAKGRYYLTLKERRWSAALLRDSGQAQLSFFNLLEAHVLLALRKAHRVPMKSIRRAVEWIKNRYRTEYPLLHPGLATDGLSLLVEEMGHWVNASERGQTEMREIISAYLRRIERDENGLPRLFYPFTRPITARDSPCCIVIDPAIAFGRPVITGTRINAAAIAERFAAGDRPELLARDYNLAVEAVYEAIRIATERIAA